MDRDTLLSHENRAPRETVEVLIEGKPERFVVRGLMGHERDAFEQSIVGPRGRGRNFANARARFLVKCIVNDDGSPMFAEHDAERVGRLPAYILDPLFAVAQRLSGITAKDAEEIAGN